MKIEIIRTTIADGKRVEAGKTYEVSDKNAKYLIQLGKAKEAVETKKTEKTKE